MDGTIKKINKEFNLDEDLGYFLSKFESLENSFPYYKSMLKKE
jgi:hypothetical protein